MSSPANRIAERMVVFGAGGFGREVAWLLESNRAQDGGIDLVFVDDDEALHGRRINGIEVVSWQRLVGEFADWPVLVSFGEPQLRERVVRRCEAAGLRFGRAVQRTALMSPTVEIGTGSVICAGSVLTVNISLGAHVHVNLDCTVGHDARIGDFTTLTPGVHVSGRVAIGKRVYIGTGANIINGASDRFLEIGDDAVIGAGACVIRDVEAGTTVVGVPAKRRG